MSCAPIAPICAPGQVLGTDNSCYSCSIGTPTVGLSVANEYCSAPNSGDVSCCTTTVGWTGIGRACNPGYCWTVENDCCPKSAPYPCDGRCYTSNVCNYTTIVTACY